VPVLFEIGLVTYVTNLFNQIETSRLKAVHARELTSHLNSIINSHVQRVSLLILRKMKDQQRETEAESALKKKVRAEIAELGIASKSTPTEQTKWNQLTKLFADIDEALDEASLAYLNGHELEATMRWTRAQSKLNQFINISNQLTLDQQKDQAKSEQDYQTYDRRLRLALKLSLFLSVAIAFGLALFFNQSTTRRLNKLMQNTKLLAMGRAPGKFIGGDDELAKIDSIHHQMHDILMQLRQKERAILDNAAEAICAVDSDLKLIEFNNAAKRLWQRSAIDLNHARLIELISDDDRENVVAKLEEAETSASEVRFEAKIRSGKGSSTTWLDTAWSVTWSQSNASLYCVISDISARKKLEQLKRDFVAMLSHDLRTPLSSVQASLELVSSEHFQLPDNALKYINRAERGLQLSLALINQLLEIEKMESGVISLSLDALSTQELFNKASYSVASLAESRRVKISYEGPSIEFVGDSERLVQVLINLLGNAIKFSPDDSRVTVTAELQHVSDHTAITRINVTDEGRGIPTENLEQIFERFQQVNPRNDKEKSGTGLGLAICKAIVEAHGGRIGVNSQVGRGSTFWFEIPLS
jgi:PAS domain S-box-containing protein